MINSDRLEDAIEFRDKLKKLRTFKRDLWNGPVTLTFGSYECAVTTRCFREQIIALLESEERMLVNTLELFGVFVDE